MTNQNKETKSTPTQVEKEYWLSKINNQLEEIDNNINKSISQSIDNEVIETENIITKKVEK